VSEEIRVCVDRTLKPDTAVIAAERAIAEHGANAPAAGRKTPLSWDERVRLALETAKLWRPGRTLRIRFLDGDPEVHVRVQTIASEWMDHASVRLEFVQDPPVEIRVAFTPGSSWSWVGTEALTVPLTEPTMNLGWLTAETTEEDCRRVVLHEFGHVLGCIHEHMSPDGGIQWNRPAVYAYYEQPPYSWSHATTDSNVFAVYDKAQTQFSTFDPQSIMLYPIPKGFTTNGFEAGWNTSLSATDIEFIGSVYPLPDSSLVVLECDGPALDGRIAENGATVRYRFEVAKAAKFVLETSGDEDLTLEVRGADNEANVAGRDRKSSGRAGNARIEAALKEGGYVAEVSHQRPTGKGSFSISLKRA
jgi:hypothetical protein